MPSLCQDIANEYNELIKLRDAFLIEHNKGKETGDLRKLNKSKRELEKKRDSLMEKLWSPYYHPRELKRVEKKDNYKLIETLEGHTGSVFTLQVLPDGRIVSGSDDKTVKIWTKKEG